MPRQVLHLFRTRDSTNLTLRGEKEGRTMNSWIQFKGTASMKNKNPMRFCLFGLLVVLLFSPCLASDDTTLVVFSRHTFRGISTKVAPQKIFLREYGIAIPIPNLSYGENATPQGLIIAESFAAPGLQEAAALAVGAIAENKVFDGHWDEVRAELALARRNGSQPITLGPIILRVETAAIYCLSILSYELLT